MRDALFTDLFIKQFNPNQAEELISLMPPAWREKMAHSSTSYNHAGSFFIDPGSWLKSFHTSWLKESLSFLPMPLQQRTLEAISKYTASQKISLFEKFLLQDLTKRTYPDEFVPEPLLKKSPLSALLGFSNKEKLELLDLLGLHDLAPQIKKIVQSSLLQEVQKALKPNEINYLKKISSLKERVKTTPLVLKSPIDPVALRKDLHVRGLARLKKGFMNEELMFIWHFAKGLDLARARQLLQPKEPMGSNEIAGFLQVEILSAIEAVKGASK